jgi:DNA-binding transcriptional MerR regulator
MAESLPPKLGQQAATSHVATAGKNSQTHLYKTKDVVEILGISRRQLQYWAHTDLVVPSAKTAGGHHRYAFADLVALKTAKRLIDAGISVQRIRESIRSLQRSLPTVNRPLSDLVLVTTGEVVLVFLNGSVFEAVSGQEWVFEVAQFQREVDAWETANQAGPIRSARSVRSKLQWSDTA